MASYAFETITAAQALAITGADTLSVAQASGTATGATVLYATDGSGDISLSFGGQAVLFGPGLAALTHTPGALTFADGTLLYVGDGGDDRYNALTFSANSSGVSTAAFGGSGFDNLAVNGPHDLLQGNAGDDTLTGNSGADTIYGGQGDDSILTGGGANFAQGNKGDDTIAGAGTDDTLLGGQGADVITGAGILDGNLGADTISGGGQLLGEDGNDSLSASASAMNTSASGGDGNDTLASTGGADDTLSGGNGNDSLVAGSGSDSISGDAGNDTIGAAGHAHHLAGGAGADVFLFGTGTTMVGTVPGIVDWTASEDRISFLGYAPNPSDYTSITTADYAAAVANAAHLITDNHFTFVAVQVGADVVIFAGGSSGITSAVELIGRSLNDFDPHTNLI